MEKIEIKELSQEERLNSRLNICMNAYIEKSASLVNLTIYAYRKFKEILGNQELMSKLPADKLQLVKDAMEKFEPNKEIFENSNLSKEKINCRTEVYIMEFKRNAEYHMREISGILAEFWLLTTMADEVDDEVQKFMDTAFEGEELSVFKNILDNLDNNELKDIKDLYMTDPKLSLGLLRDKVQAVVDARASNKEVEETINNVEEEIMEEIKETEEKVKEEMKKDKETEKEVNEEFKKKDVKPEDNKYKKYLKYAAIAAVGLAVGYVGKKIYDNCTSDDIIIIDTDGIDNLDIMSSSCSVSLF